MSLITSSSESSWLIPGQEKLVSPLGPDNFYEWQITAIKHQLSCPQSMMWVPMGRGKTPITLTTIRERMNRLEVFGNLVLAPKRVCQLVWRQEAKKWSHLKDLTFSLVSGTADQRTRALYTKADIHLINYENMQWLADELTHRFLSRGLYLPFNQIIFDEVTKVKNFSAKRHEHLRKLLPFIPYRSGLTGEPAANGYQDLFGQYLAVDSGVRLGYRKGDFEKVYMQSGGSFKKVLRPGADAAIKDQIADITYMIEGHDDLPPFMFNDIMIELPEKIRKQYDTLEKEMFMELDNGVQIEVSNTGAKYNKCLQAANGALYFETGNPDFEVLHDEKLNALDEVMTEANGSPVLLLYSFVHDFKRIKKRYPNAEFFSSGMSDKEANDLQNRWNRGEIPLFLGHPACLHPSTEVFTELRGWVKLIDVKRTDRVYDGVEFVNHDGCSYSGYKDTIEVFGVIMTPNHKLLIGDEWIEAKDIDCGRHNYDKTPHDVYDLVNCGPRSRFLIRNDAGEMFISHNSMGHGLNLQLGGNIVVWYGLNWSLELYNQANARLRRDGMDRSKNVIVHRILCNNTLDLAVLEAMVNKAATQEELMNSINSYRRRRAS